MVVFRQFTESCHYKFMKQNTPECLNVQNRGDKMNYNNMQFRHAKYYERLLFSNTEFYIFLHITFVHLCIL